MEWNELTPGQTFLGVIIPVYNCEKYLEEAVRSVLNQPCKDLIVVIINDGSRDQSLEIAKRLEEEDNRVTVINQENQGVSAARNAGIEYCLTRNVKYIGFLDADDVWVKNFYSLDLYEQMKSERMDAYHFSYYLGNESLAYGKMLQVSECIQEKKSISLFGGPFWSYLYKADYFADYGIRFPVGKRVQEDETFRYLFLASINRLHCFAKGMLVYRSNGSSVCHTKSNATKRYFGDIIPAWEWAKQEVEKLPVNRADLGKGCETMQKTFLSEYIQAASEQGIPLREIITQIAPYSYLYDDDSIWVDEKSLTRWKSFHDNSGKMWLKYRVKGLIISSIRPIIRKNKLLQKRRYPVDLTETV